MARGPPPRHRLPHPELFGPHELGDDAARSEGPSLPAPAHSAACNAAARTVTTQPCRVRRANKLLSKEREHSRTNLTQAQGPRRGEHWACRARRAGFPRAHPHRPPAPHSSWVAACGRGGWTLGRGLGVEGRGGGGQRLVGTHWPHAQPASASPGPADAVRASEDGRRPRASEMRFVPRTMPVSPCDHVTRRSQRGLRRPRAEDRAHLTAQ